MLPFKLPPVEGYSVTPSWDGQNFVFGDQCTRVLEYSENFLGWSDELTALHEEAAGDNHPIDVASRKDAVAQVKTHMPHSCAVVMEIGCSSGFLLSDLANVVPEAILIGADVVKEPLYRLAKTLPGIPLIRFDLLKSPLPDNIVDVLIMLNVLEHIEDDITALKKAYNLLKPGGFLLIEVPAGPYLYDSYDKELHHFRRYSTSELHYKMNKAGFNIQRKSHLGFVLFPAFIIAKLLNKWSPPKRKQNVVREKAAQTSNSRLVRLAMEFESKILSKFQLPCGIRVLITAQRPF